METNRVLLQLTADIVASHASMNEMSQMELLREIDAVYQKLASLAGSTFAESEAPQEEPAQSSEAPSAPPQPAVSPEIAFGKEKIYCMLCGKGFKTLKRHLMTAHGLQPAEYLAMFGLPHNKPLVAEDYSAHRKELAAKLGLADKLVEARAARAAKRAASAD